MEEEGIFFAAEAASEDEESGEGVSVVKVKSILKAEAAEENEYEAMYFWDG